MKKIVPHLSSIALLLGLGFLFSLVQNQNTQLAELRNSVTELERQIETLRLLRAKEYRPLPVPMHRPSMPSSASVFKDQVFKFLYLLNGPASSENVSIPKKIRFLPDQLIIQDPSVTQDDRFFELLGVLLDEDAIQKIELPTRLRALRKELLEFGVSADLITSSKDGGFKIKINKFND